LVSYWISPLWPRKSPPITMLTRYKDFFHTWDFTGFDLAAGPTCPDSGHSNDSTCCVIPDIPQKEFLVKDGDRMPTSCASPAALPHHFIYFRRSLLICPITGRTLLKTRVIANLGTATSPRPISQRTETLYRTALCYAARQRPVLINPMYAYAD